MGITNKTCSITFHENMPRVSHGEICGAAVFNPYHYDLYLNPRPKCESDFRIWRQSLNGQ